MSTFGDLRSMIADRAWDRWYTIDLAHLTDAPLEAAQEYARPHVHDAMWGVPVVPRQCAIGMQGDHMTLGLMIYRDDASWRVDAHMSGGAAAWAREAVAGIMRHALLEHIIPPALRHNLSAPMSYMANVHREGYEPWSRPLKGEAAQAEAVLMRSAALLARGWPVTLEHAKAAIQPRPQVVAHSCSIASTLTSVVLRHGRVDCAGCQSTKERDAYDMRWGVERTGEGIQGQRVDLLVIDDEIREGSTLGGGEEE